MNSGKQSVNSFDVFDTLLARRTKTPTDIFDLVENKSGFTNFKSYRCIAQGHSDGTFDDIYVKFGELYNVCSATCLQLKELELQTEIDNSYLITTNCNLVQDGDILISDMYLSEKDIMRILRAHGFQKQVFIFVSPYGKGSGRIWPVLKMKYDIKLHMGDNEHSDVIMATKNEIKAELNSLHHMNDIEKFFETGNDNNHNNNNNVDFAMLLREFRHKNPYKFLSHEYELYNDQASFNIPLLVLCSNHLYHILKTENRTTLLLITRDGCLLQHIFNVMYPDITCKELQSSRNVNINPNQEYKDYLKSLFGDNNIDTCLIFDVFGGFVSGRNLFLELFKKYPRVHLLGYDTYFKGSSPFEGLTFSSNKCFESFNMDCIGSLVKLENGIFLRPPVIEYEISDAIIYKNTVQSFCSFISPVLDTLSSDTQNVSKLKELSHSLLPTFIETFSIDRNSHLRGRKFNEAQIMVDKKARIWNHQSLTSMANALGVTKGSTSGCCHSYTDYYEILLLPWYNKPCSILEIGLSRYGTSSIPSINLWKAYMDDNQTRIYGYDDNIQMQKFNDPANKIEIIIGNQRNIKGIQQCIHSNKKYDIVIDDGDHDSKGQQYLFKTLWSSLNSGGLYCFESLHWQPGNDYGTKTQDLLLEWKKDNICSSEFISVDEAHLIYKDIKSITFQRSKSHKFSKQELKQAFCVVCKK